MVGANPCPCSFRRLNYSEPIDVGFRMERGLLKYYPDGAAKKTGVHFGGPIMPGPWLHRADWCAARSH